MKEIIAAAISSAVAFMLGLLVNWQGGRQFFSSTVSRERMVWIKDIRALCAELCTICEQYDNAASLPEKQRAAFLKARNGILIRLDPKEWYEPSSSTDIISEIPDFI